MEVWRPGSKKQPKSSSGASAFAYSQSGNEIAEDHVSERDLRRLHDRLVVAPRARQAPRQHDRRVVDLSAHVHRALRLRHRRLLPRGAVLARRERLLATLLHVRLELGDPGLEELDARVLVREREVGLGILGRHQQLELRVERLEHERPRVLEIEVADHNDGRLLRDVVVVDVLLDVGEIEGAERLVRADDRARVRVARRVEHLRERALERADGRVLVVLTELVSSDLRLGPHVLLGDVLDGVLDPDRLEVEQRNGRVDRRERHVVGEVGPRRRVEITAELEDRVPVLGQVAVLRAEVEVLDHVRDAVVARLIVRSAAVDDRGDRDDRLGALGLEQDAEPAREAEVRHVDRVLLEVQLVRRLRNRGGRSRAGTQGSEDEKGERTTHGSAPFLGGRRMHGEGPRRQWRLPRPGLTSRRDSGPDRAEREWWS